MAQPSKKEVEDAIERCKKEPGLYWMYGSKTGKISYLRVSDLHRFEARNNHICYYGPCERFVLWDRYRIAGSALKIYRLFKSLGGEYSLYNLRDIITEGFDPYINPNIDDICNYEEYSSKA